MIKLFFHPSPNPLKIALFLEESNIPYEIVVVDTRKGDQHKPEFIKINPNAKTPALLDGDVRVFDSNAIMLYLSEKYEKFFACKERRKQSRDAVLVDVCRHGYRPVLWASCSFQTLRS